MIAPAIAVNHAALTYQNCTIFRNINLTLPAGKWVALLGPSGVGKSSLLRFIADLHTEQAILTGHMTASNGIAIPSQIAYMAQTDLLLPWATTLENACLGGKLRASKHALNPQGQTRAINLLERVGLGHALSLYPHQLSGGMRQRVALVRTILEDKPVILMDEPFSALDAITRHQLQALAAEMLQDKTVLFITHDPAEAARLAHEIYVMEGQPANLRHLATLTTATPRAIDDPHVIQLQTQLLEALTISVEMTT